MNSSSPTPETNSGSTSDGSEFIETDWTKKWARFAPQSIAFQDADSALNYSYGEILYLSCQLADHLQFTYGIRHGDRVAVLAQNEIEYLPLFFAVQRLGAILVPLNFRLTVHELRVILGDAQPTLLVVQSAYAQLVEPVPISRWNFDGAHGTREWLAERQMQFNRNSLSATIRHLAPSWFRESLSKFEDACMILYTSGTTGAPKGAVITNKMLHWNSINTSLRLNIIQSDVTIGFSPLFHTSGWNVLLTPFIHRGAKTILMRKFSAERALELCEKERVTILFGVPTTMSMMVQQDSFATANLSSIRYAVVGGEPMSLELIKTWQIKGIPIRQGYGLTEFGPGVFSLNQEDAIRKIGSIGFANFFVETRVLNEHGCAVQINEVGELQLRGPVCMAGYWNRSEATKETIVDGWLQTGDLVRFDDEGFFYVVGRKKDMFISGGENVYPAEIEQVIATHPSVREVAVIGVTDEKWGQVGKAFLVLRQGASINFSNITQHCAERLAKYKVPKSLTIIDELPKGPSGKIQKSKLTGL